MKPGWKTSEHWIAVGVIAVLILVLWLSRDAGERVAATAGLPVVAAGYAAARTTLKIRFAAFLASMSTNIGDFMASTPTTVTTTTATTSLIETGLSFLIANAGAIDGYLADVVGKGLRAKHPNSAPSLEQDVNNAAAVITAAAQGIVASVSAVKSVVADIK